MIRDTVTDGQYQAVVKFILLQHSPKFFSKKKTVECLFEVHAKHV